MITDMYIVAVAMVKEAEMPIRYYSFPDLDSAKKYYEEMKANRYTEDVRIYMKTPLLLTDTPDWGG